MDLKGLQGSQLQLRWEDVWGSRLNSRGSGDG